MAHNFAESLAKSHRHANAHWWMPVYRQAFPNLAATVNVRDDGWAQRGGIDRILVLESGKTLQIDEKVREKDWPDIALEYWSDERRKVPGWVAKDLSCDFIAYAFIPSATCYLLPFQTLRAAWRLHCRDWVKRHKRIAADNGSYTTVSVGVPISELLDALTGVMRVSWAPEDDVARAGKTLARNEADVSNQDARP